MNTAKLLRVALDIGEKMLISGAEIGRVEDSVKRILMTYDMRRADVFTITSSIVATVTDSEENTITQTRRISKYSTDLDKLHSLNALSRKICAEKLELSQIQKELSEIDGRNGVPYGVGLAEMVGRKRPPLPARRNSGSVWRLFHQTGYSGDGGLCRRSAY